MNVVVFPTEWQQGDPADHRPGEHLHQGGPRQEDQLQGQDGPAQQEGQEEGGAGQVGRHRGGAGTEVICEVPHPAPPKHFTRFC